MTLSFSVILLLWHLFVELHSIYHSGTSFLSVVVIFFFTIKDNMWVKKWINRKYWLVGWVIWNSQYSLIFDLQKWQYYEVKTNYTTISSMQWEKVCGNILGMSEIWECWYNNEYLRQELIWLTVDKKNLFFWPLLMCSNHFS